MIKHIGESIDIISTTVQGRDFIVFFIGYTINLPTVGINN